MRGDGVRDEMRKRLEIATQIPGLKAAPQNERTVATDAQPLNARSDNRWPGRVCARRDAAPSLIGSRGTGIAYSWRKRIRSGSVRRVALMGRMADKAERALAVVLDIAEDPGESASARLRAVGELRAWHEGLQPPAPAGGGATGGDAWGDRLRRVKG